MLVLSRRAQESIRIGDDIEIVVTKVRGNTVSLGIRAPRDVPVTRSELTFRGGAFRASEPESSGQRSGVTRAGLPTRDSQLAMT